MKSLRSFSFLSLAALSCVLFLSGCQAASPENGHIDDIPLDRRIGIIRSLGTTNSTAQGTHLLQMDGGDTILLRSLAINLDDDRYANVTVEVRGALNYSKDGKPLMDIMNIDVLDQPEFLVDNAPQWKTYTSSELGFSLQYRDDLTLIEKSNGVSFERSFVTGGANGSDSTQESSERSSSSSEGGSRLAVHRFSVSATEMELAEDQTFEDYLKKTLASGQAALLQPIRIGAQALDAYKVESSQSVTFYVHKEGGPLYTLLMDFGSDEETVTDQQIFYEILGNFRLGTDSGNDLSSDKDSEGTRQGESADAEESMMSDEKEKTSSSSPSLDFETDDFDKEQGSGSTTTSVDVAIPENFGLFESSTLKFSVGYPKQWYFSSVPGESGVSRRYEFGGKGEESTEEDIKIDTAVTLDLLSSPASGNNTVKAGDKTFTTSSSGGSLSVYVKGKSGKTYRLTGDSASENTLLQMALTLEEQ